MVFRFLQRSWLAIVTSCLISLGASLSLRGQEADFQREVPELGEAIIEPAKPDVLRWWEDSAAGPILDAPNWVSFDVRAVVVDALAHNPRIAAVSHQAAGALERIVQEDAVFDPAVLLSSKYASTNDPVGNTLTTGGPPRLIQDSWNNRAGVVKTTRTGTRLDLSQNTGLLNSNSLFFEPANQGNSQLNLSITKPLRSGSGQFYNERLILRARIDSRVTLQQMRDEVQVRIASTMIVYWRLYQSRCDLIQSQALLERGLEIARLVEGRRGFDSGELEISKVNTRIARRRDALIEKERELKNLQTQLVALVASDSLRSESGLELIPLGVPSVVDVQLNLRDLVINAFSNRPDVRSAALDMESASLEISITRNELLPKLDAIVGGYLAGLNGRNDVARSLGDQFSQGRPGINAGLEYEVPYGRRASRSRNRAAHQRFLEMSERYREAVALTASEVEIAARNIDAAIAGIRTKKQVLKEASNQEFLVRSRWETLGPDGRHAGLVLEDMLDQQENRSNAEQNLVAAEVSFLLAMIELQQATGTLLTTEGIEPTSLNRTSVQWNVTEELETSAVNAVNVEAIPAMETMVESEAQ